MSLLDSFSSQETNVAPKPHYLLTAFAWIVLISLVACVYLYQTGHFVFNPSPVVNSTSSIQTTPTLNANGYILLNLGLPKGPLVLYLYDFHNQSLIRSNIQAFTPTASADGRYFVGGDGLVDTKTKDLTGSINMYDTVTATTSQFVGGINGLPRSPQISSKGNRVVFSTPPTNSDVADAALIPDKWKIDIVSQGGTPKTIAHGLYPHWSPDGTSILYVSDEGLRLYHVSSSTDEIVFNLEGGTASSLMALSVSRDGTHLAWTDPNHSKLMIAHIYSWSPFSANVEKILNVQAFAPVYAPDGAHIAFEQVTPGASSTTATTNLVMYDIKADTFSSLMSLDQYDQSRLFITDWVAHL